MAKERWLDPWSDAYHAHQGPLREAIQTQDPQTMLRSIHEHLPAMIEIRNEVAELPIPTSGYGPGFLGSLWYLIMGRKASDDLEIEQKVTLQVWDETIGAAQRELRRIESSARR